MSDLISTEKEHSTIIFDLGFPCIFCYKKPQLPDSSMCLDCVRLYEDGHKIIEGEHATVEEKKLLEKGDE